jgi:hypothetical protein
MLLLGFASASWSIVGSQSQHFASPELRSSNLKLKSRLSGGFLFARLACGEMRLA